MRLLPYTLQKRFLVGLILIMLITGTFFVLILRKHMNELFLSEAESKANLMVAHVESIQHYVRSVLRPITSELIGSDEFIIEAMSTSYVSRRILSGLNFAEHEFTYRRVAKNARNPDFEVNQREEAIFNIFLADPALQRKESVIKLGGKKHLMVARPVYFSESCIRCHGDPADAPAVLLTMYGDTRGFYRQSGELFGLDIISVPMESATGAIGKSFTAFALCFAGGMLMLLLSVQGFFNRLVVHNLRRVGHILQQKFPQEETRAVLAPLRKETEIEGMIQSIEAVASHLSEAREQLSDYAKNLEGMVKDRTADLEAVLNARSADVRVFMRLLSDLNNTQDKRTLLRTSLSLLARHFAAERAAYICGMSGFDQMEWPDFGPEASPESRAELREQLKIGEPAMRGHSWYIPVQSSGQTRGMLALYWSKEGKNARRSGAAATTLDPSGLPRGTYFPLAMSLGKQLGIALDNLDALDVLLRQNSLLDSIVEGVSDPLILVERGTTPVLANSSARELAKRLLTGNHNEGAACSLVTEADFGHAGVSSQGNACLTDLLALMGVMELPLQNHLAQREVSLVDGRSFAVGIHLIPWHDPDRSGSPRAVVHLREITEEKRILSHMRQSEKLAAVGQLAAGLAHEINNPLGVIRCYAELLGSAGLDEQSQADLNVILRHVDQAQSVLRDMLDFSRSRESCPGFCDIRELLQGVMEIFRPQARSARMECCLELDDDLPGLYIDKSMLEQVIVNLLLNALDAVKKFRAPGEGLLTLRAVYNAGEEEMLITVLDNGPGIPDALLSKIFDPFFTTKDPGAGTGLGLTIVFGMVSDMGGRLDVESPVENERGTAMRITLPVTGLRDSDAFRPDQDESVVLSHE